MLYIPSEKLHAVTTYVIFEKQGPCPRHDTRAEPLGPILKNLILNRSVGADDGVLSDMVQSRFSSQTLMIRPSYGTAVALTMLRHFDVVFAVHTHPVDEKRLNEFYEKELNGAAQFA